jgi:hypothetical protein
MYAAGKFMCLSCTGHGPYGFVSWSWHSGMSNTDFIDILRLAQASPLIFCSLFLIPPFPNRTRAGKQRCGTRCHCAFKSAITAIVASETKLLVLLPAASGPVCLLLSHQYLGID